MPARLILRGAGLLLALATAGAAAAQPVVLYRCTDAAGQLTVQNQPCPAGSTQREQVVGGLGSTPAGAQPAPQAPARDAAPAIAGGTPGLLDSNALARERAQAEADSRPALPPPPALYRCSTREGDRYLSESGDPAPRCLPLRTVGLDGDPAAGAGQACEVVRDRCEAVAADDACKAWRDHARQAQTRWRLAHPDNVEWRQRDYERIAAIVAASCGD